MENDVESGKKTAVITGATSGIGFATAGRLAGLGWSVIGVGREAGRCAEAERAIKAEAPGAEVLFLTADLGSQRQIRGLATAIKTRLDAVSGGRLDALVNNAGAVSNWYVATEDGYEMQFAVNHLAPFLLTHELLPALRLAPAARIITTSSGSHYGTRMYWRDVMLRRGYSCLRAYKQSKLANVLFTHELNRRLAGATRIRAYAADPGLVDTAIGEKGTSGIVRWVWRLRRRGGVAPAQAAATIVHLAASPALTNPQASYWKECKPKRPSRYAEREDAMRRLWELSARLCGVEEKW